MEKPETADKDDKGDKYDKSMQDQISGLTYIHTHTHLYVYIYISNHLGCCSFNLWGFSLRSPMAVACWRSSTQGRTSDLFRQSSKVKTMKVHHSLPQLTKAWLLLNVLKHWLEMSRIEIVCNKLNFELVFPSPPLYHTNNQHSLLHWGANVLFCQAFGFLGTIHYLCARVWGLNSPSRSGRTHRPGSNKWIGADSLDLPLKS